MSTPLQGIRWALILAGCALSASAADLRIGIVGLDTSHVTGFASLLNDPSAPRHVAGGRIVAAYKGGSPDVDASATRIEAFTKEMTEKWGVKLYPSIEEMTQNVDAVMICSVDGRKHMDAARKVFPYGKPVFIDKPMAASLEEVVELFRLAKMYKIPMFSSSALRFTPDIVKVKETDVGRLLGVSLFGPGPREPHVPDMYFYGIHSVDKAYLLMGTGCQTVVRTHTANTDVVTGVWGDGRVATIRTFQTLFTTYPASMQVASAKKKGARVPYLFGVLKFGFDGVAEGPPEPHTGYRELLVEIMKFFQTGVPPVSAAETVEVFAFMDAADESKRRGGVPVSVPELIRAAGGLGIE
jgi:predicted dehydrogenase